MNINSVNLQRNGSLRYGNNPNKIILHHAEMDGSIEAVNQVHLDNGWSMIGYNYYVRKDGSVWEGRPVDAIGANCYGQNATSIGVCFEGNFMKDTMPDAQYNAGVELCKYLLQQHPQIHEIGPHKKYYNTDCPGTNFPIDRMINASLSGGPVYVAASTTSNIGILKLWSSGSSVKDLQEKLNKLGYSISADGIYGPNTYNAVEHFQASKGLSVDGIAGQNTLNALNSAYSVFTPNGSIKQLQSLVGANPDNIAGQETLSKCPMLSVGSQGNTVKWLQYVVRVNADGIFGNGTKIAVQNYQAAHGLSADGIVGQATWKKILRL